MAIRKLLLSHYVNRMLNALLRRLRQLWAASAVITCPECYLGGWEPGACERCRAREGCRETVVLP